MLTARLLDALIGPRMYENQVGTVRALMTKEEFDDLLAWNDRCLAAGKRSER